MSEITIGEVLSLSQSVDALLYVRGEQNQRTARRMPFKVKHKLIKAMDKFKVDVEPYEKERIELVKKYGEPIEEGKEPMKVSDDKLEDFYKELSETLQTLTEVNLKYCKLSDADIDAIEGDDIDMPEEIIRVFQKYMIIDPEEVPTISVA